ncbi:metal-dependent hydrolase [Nocardia colli]|uniref:Metal-dependent hydrolase n=1 Tax=Nocardia colli TaxID=2545717 RepID=A0A5N0EIZ9_9NOCA|nr:metal-dependent hydrolase [Nocardia colli]KAA8889367.1 metal-dependent hydrolase [Nocardia colli]
MTSSVQKTGAGGYPKVRRMKFRFGEPEPMTKYYAGDDIVLSHLVALLSAAFPPGEESFIRSVRRFADQITDPVLKKRVAAFIGQEAVHGQQHGSLNEQLFALGYPLPRFVSGRGDLVQRAERLAPPAAHLAITAAAEHYTAVLAARVLSSPEIQELAADPEVRNLLNWHALEELEHKSVAFDVYRSVGGPEWLRIAIMSVLYVFTIPVVGLGVLASILADPPAWQPITVTRQSYRLIRGPIVRGLLSEIQVYLKPGFHPDDVDTGALLRQWQTELFGADGALVDRVR